MKHTLHFFLITIFLLSGINSFAENKSNNNISCPIIQVSFNSTICNGGTTNITLSSDIAGTSYAWSCTSSNLTGIITNGDNTNINQALNLVDANNNGYITYSVIGFANGCFSGSQDITITVNPIPGTPIGLPNNEICSGEITNLTISSFSNIAGTMLEWTVTDSQNVTGFTLNGSGLSPLNISDELANTSNFQGFVKYSVTSKLGNCFGNTTDYIVFVNPLPISSLADGAIYEDNNSNIIPYILNTGLDNTNYSFDWFLFNTTTNTYELIAGANASTYEAIVVGNYQVIVTNLNTNCYTQDEAEVVLLLNSNNFEKNADLKIFPNPVTDILNIENEFQINSIKVYNQLGQMIFGKEINNNTTQLDLSVINSGIYNVLIETEKGTVNHKIVKK